MPPTRTIPPAKAVKTERTHEENQERAYIAASRRSDRSLEARVESARRASEIHKRRTGRSLRVTEQDVVNEEMYEEEDDDLPSQYRRLTAHLQTSNPVFNSRLSAYLTNNVAMRRALEQSIHDSYAQQYGNNPSQQYNLQPMFPSPMLGSPGQPQMMYPQSPTSYRHAPYPPRPHQQSFQPSQHQRSASIATPQEMAGTTLNSPVSQPDNSRRMSMPVVPVATTNSPVQTRTPISIPSESPQLQPATKPSLQHKPSFPPGSFTQRSQVASMPSYDMNHSTFPFTTALSGNLQGLLGDTLNPNDPFTSQLMAGSGTLPGNFYDFSTQPELPATTNIAKSQTHPSFDGLTSTLAPAAADASQPTFDYNSSYFNDAFSSTTLESTPNVTPGANDNSWTAFFDTDAYEQPTS